MTEDIGYTTDFFFLQEGGIIERRPECLMVITPSNPTYYFGNFLLLDSPPGDRTEMEQLFRHYFAERAGIEHYTFCWRGIEKRDYSEYVDAGYEYAENVVLTCNARQLVRPEKLNEEVSIRPLLSRADQEQWFAMIRDQRDAELGHYGTDRFIRWAIEEYNRLTQKGMGNFFGAFLGDVLVSVAGLYRSNGVGRFQQVVTDYRHYNKGICKTLLHSIAAQAFEDLHTLVIIADNNYHAARLYRSLGFRTSEYQSSLYWWPRTRNEGAPLKVS